jgi:ribosomal protein S12 methylthiotransferase accessory factor
MKLKLELVKNEEENKEMIIKKYKKFIDPETGIIKFFGRAPHFNDEPKFFRYFAILSHTILFSDVENYENTVGGTSPIKEKAIIKTLGESIERYCLSVYRKSMLLSIPHNKIKNIMKMKNFMGIQKLSNLNELKWVKGFSLPTLTPTLIPAQLVYVPYDYGNEPILRECITTGAASGTSLSATLYRGICEVVERDAFMLNYLNKLHCPKITYRGNNEIIYKMIEEFEKYNIEPYLFDITLDIKIPTVMCILIDHSEIGPAVSIGLKTGINYEENIIDAMSEAEQTRPWIREVWLNSKLNKHQIKANEITSLEKRGIFWYSKKMIKFIKFWLNTKKKKEVYSETRTLDDFSKLKFVLKKVKRKIFFVDVTTPEIKKEEFFVIKSIIPSLQPLYINENFKCLVMRRVLKYLNLKNAKKINKTPHPFL